MATRTWRANSTSVLTLVSDWGGVDSEAYVDGRESGDDAARTVSYAFPGWSGGATTDALVIDIGVASSPGGPWTSHRFVTGQLGTAAPRAETWTVTYYLFNGWWTEDGEGYAEFIYGVAGVPANIDGIADYWPASMSVASAGGAAAGLGGAPDWWTAWRTPGHPHRCRTASRRTFLPKTPASEPATEPPIPEEPPAVTDPAPETPPATEPPPEPVPEESLLETVPGGPSAHEVIPQGPEATPGEGSS